MGGAWRSARLRLTPGADGDISRRPIPLEKAEEAPMPYSRQAKKRVRQTLRRSLTNKARMSRVRTFIRRVETAIVGGDQEVARAALRAAQPEIMRGVTKGVLKRNTASRRVSRLARQVKAMSS